MQAHSLNFVLIRTLLGLSIGMLAANSAFAEHRHHHHDIVYERAIYPEPEGYSEPENYSEQENYGRVIDARPIYQSVAVEIPQESCRVETIAHQERGRNGDSFAGTVMGGLVGAAIGHQIGHGRGGATAVGGLIGASIGNDASRGSRAVTYRDQEVCDTHYRTEYENRIVGYDVSYSYQGRVYQTRTNRHPGDRIAVAVEVRPSYQD